MLFMNICNSFIKYCYVTKKNSTLSKKVYRDTKKIHVNILFLLSSYKYYSSYAVNNVIHEYMQQF